MHTLITNEKRSPTYQTSGGHKEMTKRSGSQEWLRHNGKVYLVCLSILCGCDRVMKYSGSNSFRGQGGCPYLKAIEIKTWSILCSDVGYEQQTSRQNIRLETEAAKPWAHSNCEHWGDCMKRNSHQRKRDLLNRFLNSPRQRGHPTQTRRCPASAEESGETHQFPRKSPARRKREL